MVKLRKTEKIREKSRKIEEKRDIERKSIRKSIIRRLEELEIKYGDVIPIVIAEYKNGERIEYKGLPPLEHITREVNPIVGTSGSEFADLVNAIISPVPNRNIEDFE